MRPCISRLRATLSSTQMDAAQAHGQAPRKHMYRDMHTRTFYTKQPQRINIIPTFYKHSSCVLGKASAILILEYARTTQSKAMPKHTHQSRQIPHRLKPHHQSLAISSNNANTHDTTHTYATRLSLAYAVFYKQNNSHTSRNTCAPECTCTPHPTNFTDT